MNIIERERGLEKNKRAWLKIFEAAIAVMLMIGFFSILAMRHISSPDLSEEVYDLKRAVLKDLSQSDAVRQSVLDGDAVPVYEFVKVRLSSSLRFAVRICNPDEECDFPVAGTESAGTERYYPLDLVEPELNIYSGDYLVSSSLNEADSILVKLFIWFSDAPADTTYDEQVCGDGDYDEEVEEECEITSTSSMIFFDIIGQILSPLTCEDKIPGSILGNLACDDDCDIDSSACDACDEGLITFVGEPEETGEGYISFTATGQSGTYSLEIYNPQKELIGSEEQNFVDVLITTSSVQYPTQSGSLIVIRYNDKCQNYFEV